MFGTIFRYNCIRVSASVPKCLPADCDHIYGLGFANATSHVGGGICCFLGNRRVTVARQIEQGDVHLETQHHQ